LIVENSDSNHQGYDELVDDIVRFIISHECAAKSV